MATIDEVLQDTMLAAANPSRLAKLHLPKASLPYMLKKPSLVPDEDRMDAAIWNYDSPRFADKKVRVTNLTCRVNAMKAEMGVCKLIEWGPVTFYSEDLGTEVTLPLEETYLIRSHFLSKGTIQPCGSEGSSGAWENKYWKLPANTDQSFELVFGYEFPPFTSTDKPSPISDERLATFGDPHAKVCVANPRTSTTNTLRVPPLRILVVASLVTGKERNDFDPKGALGAGRLNPTIMVLSNQELKSATGTVKFERPANVTMKMDDCDMDNMPARNYIEMDGEFMHPEIGAVLFTDRNSMPPPIEPNWSVFFDYFDTNPKLGKYVMAYPPADKPARTVPDAFVKVKERVILPMGGMGFSTSKRKVTKTAGQGEFDNIHVAPKMFLREQDLHLPLLVNRDRLRDLHLNAITMAPFCVHDCLHLHTRWSDSDSDPQTLGWQDELTPNAAQGAPLVPPNQTVTLELLSPHSFTYTAKASNVQPSRWQIMLHHGAGYALSTGALAWLTMKAAASFVSSSTAKWTAMYWNFRWVMGPEDSPFGPETTAHERLTLEEGMLEKLREVARDAAKAAAGGR